MVGQLVLERIEKPDDVARKARDPAPVPSSAFHLVGLLHGLGGLSVLLSLEPPLAARLAAPQLIRLRGALQAAGLEGEAAIRSFLEAMINAEDRPKVSAITNPTPLPGTHTDEDETV